jgi:tight adherence protein B
MRADGAVWLALPLIAMGLWLVHDGLQGRVVGPPRRPSALAGRVQDYLVQADLERWTLWRVLVLCLLGTAGAGLVVQLALAWPLATLVAVPLGALVPVLWVRSRHGRIHAETRQGLATALAQLGEGLAVGHTIERGAQTLAVDGPPRLCPHFAQFCRDADQFGLAQAALHLRDGLADPIADLFVAGLLLHVELGGNNSFHPMLRQLEQMTRAQLAVREQLAAARVRLKLSSYVLVGAPVVILLALRAWSPALAAFFDSPEGALTLALGALAMLGGYLLMLYVGRLPDEERVLVR